MLAGGTHFEKSPWVPGTIDTPANRKITLAVREGKFHFSLAIFSLVKTVAIENEDVGLSTLIDAVKKSPWRNIAISLIRGFGCPRQVIEGFDQRTPQLKFLSLRAEGIRGMAEFLTTNGTNGEIGNGSFDDCKGHQTQPRCVF